MSNRGMARYLLPLAIAWLSVAAHAQLSPNDVIQEAADLLDKALEGRKEELEANREKLYEVINEILLPRFDRTYAAQLVLGPHWKTASKTQRQQFIDAFYQNLLRKYADGVLEYDQSRIEILPFRGDLAKPRVIVRTMVRLDDGTKVPVDYNLVKRDPGWLLFVVTIEGISYVRNFRVEMNSEIQQSSLDAVIARLQRETSGETPGSETPESETAQ
jgi:phospholipid transport system substrate-binding protein